MASMCGEAFRRRYIERDRRSDHRVPNTIGKAVHLEAQVDLEFKIETGELIEDEAVEDIAADSFESMWDDLEPDLDESEKARGRDTVRGEAKDLTVTMAKMHHNLVAPGLNPTHVERKLELRRPDLKWPTIGYVDVQEPNKIRDLKIPARTPKAEDLDQSTQAALYPALAEAMDGVRPEVFAIDALVKLKTPKRVTIETAVLDSEHVFERIKRIEDMVDAGTFLPADPRSWKCSEKWCEFFDDCPWGRARRVSFSVITNSPEKP